MLTYGSRFNLTMPYTELVWRHWKRYAAINPVLTLASCGKRPLVWREPFFRVPLASPAQGTSFRAERLRPRFPERAQLGQTQRPSTRCPRLHSLTPKLLLLRRSPPLVTMHSKPPLIIIESKGEKAGLIAPKSNSWPEGFPPHPYLIFSIGIASDLTTATWTRSESDRPRLIWQSNTTNTSSHLL